MEGIQQEKLFGLPAWVALLALGGAGIIGYLLFFKNSGSSSSSSQQGSTGYSTQGLAVMQNPDESATMALQNQQLSMLAQEFDTFGTNLSEGFTNTGLQLTGISNQLTDQSNQIAQVGSSVNTGFSTIGTSINGISGQVTGLSNQDAAQYQSLLGSIVNYAQSLSNQVAQTGKMSQDQANQNYNSVVSYLNTLLQQGNTTEALVIANQYLNYAQLTATTAGVNDPRVVQWQQAAQSVDQKALAA